MPTQTSFAFSPLTKPNRPGVLVLDDFYQDPDAVRAFGLAQEFQPNPLHHKGQRSKSRFLFPYLKERFESLLGLKIPNWEGHGFNGVFQFCVEDDPLVYHSDHQKWAGVLYLTP